MDNNILSNENQSGASFSEVFFHYLSYWKWFLISVIVCVLVAVIYLRYVTPQYNVVSKVMIKDEKKGQTGLDLNVFSDLGLTQQIGTFENEIEVLRSKSLMKEVVDSLKIGITYHKKGRLKKEEVYRKTPVYVTLTNQSGAGSFILDKAKEGDQYTIKGLSDEYEVSFNLNEEVISPWGVLSFELNPFGTVEYPIEVEIKDPRNLPVIEITPINKLTTVVNISTITPVREKGVDIINTLVYIYNQKTISEKNYVAHNTINFINDRLDYIFGELKTAEKKVEDYKRSEGLTDIEAEAHLFLGAQTEYTKKISNAEVQLNILRDVKNFIMDPQNIGNVAPSNVGLSDPTILSLIQRYNEEVLSKNTATIGMTANNPVLKDYDDRIALLRENLIKGVSISEKGMQTELQELRNQEGIYFAKNLGLSTQERESRELYRQKEIKESLYVYLLQKSEETGLSLALATPNAVVVDSADPTPLPVKPKKKAIILVALLIGFIIPITIIYIKDLFDNKLRSKDQLKKVVTAPFLGDIPQAKAGASFPVTNVRSGIAEKFRIVASNLSFIIPVKAGQAKTIMITSSFSGEGKSFFSQNLAMSLATSGNKTLLIDLDMRKSMLNETLEMNPSEGIAMYLSDPKIQIQNIIDKSGKYHKNLHIIPIKIFPPNPAELLASKRLDLLFETVKKDYSHIVVDTAPVGLVADAYRINQFVDTTIYVTRSNYTFKSQLDEIQSLYRDNKLNHLTTILNAVPIGGRYG
ncbi:MAG: polysaccharide biosynthesis tyrosine autokinase, partial [Bacteroidales bacterium]|nr:polysaccharide biosynthesis tyrosine autokinase [Bacteroidales bacterium]